MCLHICRNCILEAFETTNASIRNEILDCVDITIIVQLKSVKESDKLICSRCRERQSCWFLRSFTEISIQKAAEEIGPEVNQQYSIKYVNNICHTGTAVRLSEPWMRPRPLKLAQNPWACPLHCCCTSSGDKRPLSSLWQRTCSNGLTCFNGLKQLNTYGCMDYMYLF